MSWVRTPKSQLLLVFGLLLSIVLPTGGLALLPNLAAAIFSACLIDGAWLLVESRRLRFPSSALLTALIVFFILSPGESWLVGGWTCAFAIAAKRLVRTARGHIFNPAALALLWAPIAFGSGESWWGALADLPWLWTIVLVIAGLLIVDRLNKFPLVLTFLASYFGLFALASLSQPQAVAEMFRAPFVQAVLFLAFFMLTDPPTSPNRYAEQVWYGLLVAGVSAAAQLLGAGQVYLLVGLVIANGVLAGVRAWRRRAFAPRPKEWLAVLGE
jgi:Na+-translocating ferredoxin:NAD+ oxidoreductase RnfD subunit